MSFLSQEDWSHLQNSGGKNAKRISVLESLWDCGLKYCTSCKAALPISEFWKTKSSSPTRSGCYLPRCKSCAKDENLKATRRYKAADKARALVHGAKQRAKRRGLPFDLSVSDIKIPDKCPVLGIEILPSNGRLSDNSPSIDRVRPDLGYVRGNVRVISWRANRIKTDATPEELMKVAEWFTREVGQ